MNIVLFDGVCNLCNSTVQFLIKHDTNNKLYFAAQQTDTGKNLMERYKITNDTTSVILIKDELVYYKSEAVIQIAKLITGWPKYLQFASILPLGLRNWVYSLIAKNRYQIFGKKDTCSIPDKANFSKFI